MTHAITRTNPLGVTPAVGKCIKCGTEGLSFADALVECPADGLVSDEQALFDILDAPHRATKIEVGDATIITTHTGATGFGTGC